MRKIYKEYGKSIWDIYSIKKTFISQNDKFLNRQNAVAKLYKKQPKRKKCKACNRNLNSNNFFKSHDVEYTVCKFCSHLNGIYQDTKEFTNKVYTGQIGQKYSSRYKEKNLDNYLNRLKKIYDPKVKFLKKYFSKRRNLPTVIDIGTGSGYFTYSLIKNKFPNVVGTDISEEQIKYGQKIFKKTGLNPKALQFINELDMLSYIKNIKSEVVCLIGVLEHMHYPREFLNVVKKNNNIKFLYICVPLFSLSVIIESNFSNVHNKHLGGTHTHLFTEKSLKTMLKKINFDSVSEWWFGSDIMDMIRSFEVSANNNELLKNKIDEYKQLIDEFQLNIDKKQLSSSIHILFKRKN